MAQKRARQLRQAGLSLKEIAQKLGVAKSSVSLWVRGVILSAVARRRLDDRERRGATRGRRNILLSWQEYRKLHPVVGPDLGRYENLVNIRTFFRTWSPAMAYVVGFFAADGCMYHSVNGGHSTGGWYVTFDSTDLSLLRTVRKLMKITNKIESYNRFPWKTKHLIRIVNKELFNRFLEIGMTPRKSLSLHFPAVPAKYLSDFVRGYFDGDGHVFFGQYRAKGRKKIRRVLQTGFTSGSRQFLVILRRRLHRVAGLGLGSLHPNGPSWELSYSARDSRQLYYFMYPSTTVPHLKRKNLVFERALDALDP